MGKTLKIDVTIFQIPCGNKFAGMALSSYGPMKNTVKEKQNGIK